MPIDSPLKGTKGGVVHVRLSSKEFATAGLQIAHLEGHEQLMGIFDFKLDLTEVGAGGAVDLGAAISEIIGAGATLVFERHGQTVRELHGEICEVDEAIDPRRDKAGEGGALTVRFVPRVFNLSLIEIHEVFLAMSVPDIIAEKLSRIGMGEGADFEWRLAGEYPPREFIVQYKETDLAFITRLCEHYGITYFFEHDGGADKMVFVDAQAGFAELGSYALASGEADEVIKSLRSNRRVVPATRGVSDYNPVNPPLDLRQQAAVPGGFGGGIIELGTNFKSPAQGNPLAGIRAEQTESHRVQLRGESGIALLRAGVVMTVSDAPTLEDPSLLLGYVRHTITQQAGLLGADAAAPYANEFRATQGQTQYRPLQSTRVPRIHGVVTAFVEEYQQTGRYAVIDDRGRYWVRFDFDSGEHPEKHSLPIRMMQPHAGASYGTHLPLKPGTEVMVAFLDGDVDRPVIMGAIPNELTQSPVNRSNYQINKLLKTETGIVIEARDVWEPDDAGSHQQEPGSV